ncbi:MAG TPA: M20/M25/M40 family metallo-hydrolase [Bacillota bacterium]|nr:M20/M25/M40 family metallo-hydrolase [Bacillota bacterium]
MKITRGRKWGAALCSAMMLLLTTGPALANQSGLQIAEEATGNYAYEVVQYLSEDIGIRTSAGPKEAMARDYIVNQFREMGYQVELQPFSYVRRGVTYNSANVIATKPGSRDDNTVIIGAHYDCAPSEPVDGMQGTGAGDNASGVGVMLEAAKVLSDYKTAAAVKFVAFGAEEAGLRGSQYYASTMTQEEIDQTVTMINLDSVGAGDFFYVYAGLEGNPGWARDLALKIGQGMGRDLRTSPQSEFYDYGTTGDWSDHAAFRALGIPVAYFEWMNWDIEPDGGMETAENGWIMHTEKDNLAFLSKDKLEQTTEVVAALTFQLAKTHLPKAEKGKIAPGSKYISVQKRPGLPQE